MKLMEKTYEELQEEYAKITEKRQNILDDLAELRKDEKIKKYEALTSENKQLYNQQERIYKVMKRAEYENCKHIFVYAQIETDDYDGRAYRHQGCIKCGLDKRVLNSRKSYFSSAQEAMYEYLRAYLVIKGVELDEVCDLELACAIYAKIKEHNPNIDDETAVKWFEIALNDIRNIKVNEERKASRIKRLSLTPNFNRWNASDVSN